MSDSEQNASPPPAETVDGAGASDLAVGDSESAIEAPPKPRKPRSAAQIAAFEKCRAARQANRDKPVVKKAPEPQPEPSKPEPEIRYVSKPRKGRSDKGKKRGYLVKEKPKPLSPPSSDYDSSSSDDEHPGMVFQFNVV